MDGSLIYQEKGRRLLTLYNNQMNATFTRVVGERDEERLWSAFAAGRQVWNGETVRLASLDEGAGVLRVERSDYRTFAMSHGLAAALACSLEEAADRRLADVLQDGVQRPALPSPVSWRELLVAPGWANTLALLLWLVNPASGTVLVVTRSCAVGDGAGARTASVCGSFEPGDFAHDVPLLHGVRRECREEIGCDPEDVRILGLIAAFPKWQPAVIAVGRLPDGWCEAATVGAVDAWETARVEEIPYAQAEFDGLSSLAWVTFGSAIRGTERDADA